VILTLALQGVRCPQADKNVDYQYKIATEGIELAKGLLLQRDVTVQLASYDPKTYSFFGYIWIGYLNFALELLCRGLASI